MNVEQKKARAFVIEFVVIDLLFLHQHQVSNVGSPESELLLNVLRLYISKGIPRNDSTKRLLVHRFCSFIRAKIQPKAQTLYETDRWANILSSWRWSTGGISKGGRKRVHALGILPSPIPCMTSIFLWVQIRICILISVNIPSSHTWHIYFLNAQFKFVLK